MTVCMNVAEYAIIKERVRVNAPLEFWGCNKPPIYHPNRFHTYRNCPNNMDPDVAERAKQSIQNHPQKIQQWEGESVPRVSNMEEVRHPQPQHVPCLQSTGFSYTDSGTRKESVLYIRHC